VIPTRGLALELDLGRLLASDVALAMRFSASSVETGVQGCLLVGLEDLLASLVLHDQSVLLLLAATKSGLLALGEANLLALSKCSFDGLAELVIARGTAVVEGLLNDGLAGGGGVSGGSA
jgi:hypothetical protein